MRLFPLLVLIIILYSGCGPAEEADRKLAPEKQNLPEVIASGKTITGQAFTTLSDNLKQALEEGGVSNALRFCNIQAMPLTDSLSRNFDVKIRRASHRPRNQSNLADSLEMVSIREYLRKIENGEELEPYTYATGSRYMYHAPIRMANPLCLNCHGNTGADISEEDLALIQKLYPDDQATGFEMGELRGIWSLSFPKAYFEKENGNGTR